MPAPPDVSPIVLGVLHPPEWWSDAEGMRRALADIEALDARIEVVVVPYEEGHYIRTLRGSPQGIEEARRLAPPLTADQHELFARAHACLAVDVPFGVGELSPNLVWIQCIGAGSAHLTSAGLGEAGIRLTNAAGVNAVAIAEFVVGRILEERKGFRALQASQVAHEWEPRYGPQLAGTTIGLLGLGAINRAVARRLASFDVEVLACRRSARAGDTAPDVAELLPTESLHELLARSDTLVAAVPETPETVGLMDSDAFTAMPRGGFFVNVGRGTLVDEEALVAALVDGRLRGAALDVASLEPLPGDHPLWDAPNLYLSFHCSADPDAHFPNLYRLWHENVRRWLAGEPLLQEVDLGARC
jgi:phosphoglycerate dehydrogenase-like enzyme